MSENNGYSSNAVDDRKITITLTGHQLEAIYDSLDATSISLIENQEHEYLEKSQFFAAQDVVYNALCENFGVKHA